MSTKRSLNTMRIFMLLAQTVLTGFIIFWLNSQYQEAKKELTSKLSSTIETSKKETIDSLIETNILVPLLNSEKGFKIKFDVVDEQINPGSDSIRRTVTSTTHIDSGSSGAKFDTTDSFNKMITIRHDADYKKDILMNGVKLIVKKVNSMDGDSSFETDAYYLNSDTALFRKNLLRHLSESNISILPEWIQKDSTGSTRTGKLIFSNQFSGIDKSLFFPSASLYVIRTITPQLLFGFVLIILTGLAFYFSHRNLQKQYRLDQLKNNLISNISHELKTPVSTVKIALEEMNQMDPVTEKEKLSEYIDLAGQEMKRMEMLISKVMNSSLMESGKMEIEKESTDLLALIQETTSQFKIRYGNNSLQLILPEQSEKLFLQIDPLHIRGVLINLIDNAFKYNNHSPLIQIKVVDQLNQVQIKVIDNGPGIPPAYHSKIFDKFFRVPQNDVHQVHGYGLGLNYCKQIITRHDGIISLECPNEGGCIFHITLPKII